jgi:subtilase family serine protease
MLTGHVAPAVHSAEDLGRVEPNTMLQHMMLQLKRSPEAENKVKETIDDLHNPKSANFHKWLSAKEFGQRFGASEAELSEVTDWLRSEGMTVEGVNDGRNMIQFSGRVAQVERSLHTEMHSLKVGGSIHMSATIEPSVPASLGGIVSGVPLSDFFPHPMVRGGRSYKRNNKTGKLTEVSRSADALPSFYVDYEGSEYQLVAPGDVAKIYNLNPLWASGYRGKGQTIAVVEDSLIKASDVASFRKAFGLSGYAGTFTQELVAGPHPCLNPGKTSAETEAALDAEWAGSTAPDANVILAGCADTQTQFGGLIAVLNMLSWKTPPQEISMSYGECETEMGTVQLNQFYYAFQQAVAEGVAIFVSSGDEGAASCDANKSYAQNGIKTSGFTTTPYNVSVGGTDFYDNVQGTVDKYWSKTNASDYSSALSYVPEKSWNNSCADSDLLTYEGYTSASGPTGFCNNYPGIDFVTTGSGSGGPSQVFSKPSWQNVAGNPADNMRDIPDVSLFSSSGFWGHGLVFCNTDKYYDGTPCDPTNAADTILNTAGGTSFAAPAMAGIFSLVTQKYGRQGNPNVGFYKLAAAEYGTTGSPKTASMTACDSTLGSSTGSNCTFHDVTKGNIAVPCIGPLNCYGTSIEYQSSYYTAYYYGELSVSSSTLETAYPTSAGWDFATGLGTLNAVNLFNNWSQVSSAANTGTTKTIGHPFSPVGTIRSIGVNF